MGGTMTILSPLPLIRGSVRGNLEVCMCLQSLSHDPITASWSWLLSHLSCQLQREKESKPVIASSHQNLLLERERKGDAERKRKKERVVFGLH